MLGLRLTENALHARFDFALNRFVALVAEIGITPALALREKPLSPPPRCAALARPTLSAPGHA
jgi:hypothetical protein